MRQWGNEADPPLLMLHGTRDSSVTFQFVVEQLRQKWCVLAPDWRGHGHSEWVRQGYWLHEFVADLSTLLDLVMPDRPIPIIGHSMGGNIASVFASLRPDKVARLVLLDASGPPLGSVPVDIRNVFETYLGQFQTRRGPVYETVNDVARRLERANRRLSTPQALFLAEHGTGVDRYGYRRWLFDPSHIRSLPTLHTREEWEQMWAGIRAPVFWLSSEERDRAMLRHKDWDVAARQRAMHGARHHIIEGTGHNLQHDAPEMVAQLIEEFLIEGCKV